MIAPPRVDHGTRALIHKLSTEGHQATKTGKYCPHYRPRMIPRRPRRSLYAAIADDLRLRISDGRYPVGSELPSIPALAAEYGAGKDAMRDALALVEAWGLITIRHGARIRVRDTRVMDVVEVDPRDHLIGGRRATTAEAVEWDVAEGAPALTLIDAVTGIELDAWAAERVRLRWVVGE